MLTLSLSLSLVLRCKLCRHTISGQPMTGILMLGDQEFRVHLGQVIPNFCPLCGQLLEEHELKDRNLRRRISRYLKRQPPLAPMDTTPMS